MKKSIPVFQFCDKCGKTFIANKLVHICLDCLTIEKGESQ